jgi:hypothetical protein
VDRKTYQELEYLTLRKEIEDSLERSFQIMIGGATLVPILVGILAYYTATPILLALPLMVVVIALLYLNQWNSIMRSGRYIRTRIEEPIMNGGGWETWLELPRDRNLAVDNRLVDTYLVYAFYLLTGAYYLATSYIALHYARTYGRSSQWIAMGVYIVIGLLMAVIIFRRVPTRTTTSNERSMMMSQSASGGSTGPLSHQQSTKAP